MGIVLAIATVLGGIAAIWFFWEKLRPDGAPMPADGKGTPSGSDLHAAPPSAHADSVAIAALNDLLDDMEKRTRRLIGWHEGLEPNTPYEQVGLEEGEVEHLEGLVHRTREALGLEKPVPTVWEPSRVYCARHAVHRPTYNETQAIYFECFLRWVQKTRAFVKHLERIGTKTTGHGSEANKSIESDK